MSFEQRFRIRVDKVKGSSPVQEGWVSEQLSARIRLGRGEHCELQLKDPTISSHHLTIERAEGQFFITNESRHGSTFVNTQAVSRGETHCVSGEACWAQIGRVLLHIYCEAQTLPISEVIALPVPGVSALTSAKPKPLLGFTRLGKRCEVRFLGELVDLFPSSARVLARLCETPGDVASHIELSNAIDPEHFQRQGGAQLAQIVTYIRTMFSDAIERGAWTHEALHTMLQSQGLSVANASDTRALLRKLVENVRGKGYRIHIPRDAIEIREV